MTTFSELGAQEQSGKLDLERLPTPCLLVDLDRLDRNIERWQRAMDERGIAFRAHIKTHKSPEIAHLQLREGARGIAVAKVAEAEVFAADGCRNIAVAYPVVGEDKWQRIAELAKHTRMTANADSETGVQGLSKAAAEHGVSVRVQIEVDTGFHRCGLPPDDVDGIARLAILIGRLPGVEFDGITTHRGVFFDGAAALSIEEAAIDEGSQLAELGARLRERGLVAREITAGGTFTGRPVAGVDGVTEVRAGTYVFNDLMQATTGAARPEDLALSVLCTVVSRTRHGWATIDGGSKTFSGDRGRIGGGFESSPNDAPLARSVDGRAVVEWLTEEHGIARIVDGDLAVGDRLAFHPYHACTTVNLADELFGVRGEQVERVFQVRARGART